MLHVPLGDPMPCSCGDGPVSNAADELYTIPCPTNIGDVPVCMYVQIVHTLHCRVCTCLYSMLLMYSMTPCLMTTGDVSVPDTCHVLADFIPRAREDFS